MKLTRFFPALVVPVLLLNYSCSKSKVDNSPPPAPVIKPDTLTSGWTKISATTTPLNDVFFSNNTTGYAVGEGLLKSIDGGSSWSKIATSWTYGSNLSVTNDGKIFVASGTNAIYRSTDGGNSFTSTFFSGGNLTDVFFIDDNTGYTIYSGGLSKTTDGGVSWQAITPLSGLALPGSYNSLFLLNTSTGWVTSGNTISSSNANFNNWTLGAFSGTPPLVPTLSVYATSPLVVYLGSLEGRIYKSTDGGANFSVLATFSQSPTGFLDIHFTDANTGYACYGNRIYKTLNAGTSWTPVVSLGETTFVEIHFTDANHGWACTLDGSILRFN